MSRPPSSLHQEPSLSETANPTLTTGARSTRTQPTPWSGQSNRQAPRSGPAPISTGGAGYSRPESSSGSPLRSAFSPTTSVFNHAATSTHRQPYSRHSSTSSSHSLSSPSASGYYATGSLHSGQRSRAVTGTGSPRLASSLASLSSLSQGGGSGGGGGGGSSRLVRHSPSVSTSTVGSPVSSTGGGSAGQLTSLVITQLSILLSTLKESNYDTQAEKIRRLLDENGMELFETYFRRLLNGSWSHLFPNAPRAGAGATNAESYRLLEGEVQRLATEPQQAEKIARALDTPDLDLDLTAFTDHFHLDPIARLALASACRTAANGALRTKADTLLSLSWQPFLSTLIDPPAKQNPEDPDTDVPEILSLIVERISQDPPRDFGDRQREDLLIAIKMRYQKLGTRVPDVVTSAHYIPTLLEGSDARLARTVQRIGPRGTTSLEACKDMLVGIETRDISYLQIANALLFMVFSHNGDAYDAGIFVEGLRNTKTGSKIDWTDVVQGFDKETHRVTKKQFLGLYNALVPLARDYANFDIQSLWGGLWQYPHTQLSFVTAFLSTTPEELQVAQIPKLRQAFKFEDYQDAPESIRDYAAEAVKHPLVSRDATEALFVMIFRSQEAYNDAQVLGIPEKIINPNMTVFLCAASAVPKPWAPLQDQALKQLFYPFLMRQHPNYDFVMHSLWMHDRSWVAQRLVEFYQSNNTLLTMIYEHAVEHEWLDALLTIQSAFGVDLAAYAHSKGQCDLDDWARPILGALGPVEFPRVILDFITVKLSDETRAQKEGVIRTTLPLALQTVYTMVQMLGDFVVDEELGQRYRQLLQIYPRLFNYGRDPSVDAVLEVTSANGHAIPEDADAEMQEWYKKMYGGEATPDEIVKELNELKVSEDPAKQDLFAAMLQGLFDEYNCFGEYPNEALATTAVLFGGLVLYHVLSGIAEQAAIYMIFEAVSEYGPDDSMYRFGLQAMIHLLGRLKEWPHLAERILRIETLQNTPAFAAAQTALKELQQEQAVVLNGDAVNGITNGSLDDEFPVDSPTPPFAAIRPDPPLMGDAYEDPNEDVSDRVMFALNNVSVRNLDEKFRDLETLDERHHQWFAHYLVEELAKSQPNFQALYLQVLGSFDRRLLWAEVLRETYISCAKMLNAPSTMEQSSERATLKNLGGWLGALTLARNHPILHRNLSFRDLLIEGHDTQRLLVAIPFTCKALLHSRTSKVFRPPNPWLMELLGLLSELYHFCDLKLNLKFEIEVLCKDLGMDVETIVPLEIIRAGRPMPAENNMLTPYVADGPDGFGDMHLMGLSKRPPNERFSPEAVIQALPDLAGVLQIPQAAGNVTQPQLRQIFVSAAQQAIYEIIAPVVERSVTIAAISTAELIQKDFATEADVEKLKGSAYTVVKALSGSLALVTCKEPLRMSITNNIRIFANRMMPEPLPEGQILMFVNDNIETVCGLVERAAEEHSLAEIDAQLAQPIDDRRRHVDTRPNEPFNNPPVSRWAQLIPEPFRLDPQGGNASGLNRQQLGLYEDFGRQARITPAAHANSMSQDARGQLPDVLSDSYLPNMPTPAEAPALPRPTPQQQRLQMQPPQGQHQVNGYIDANSIWQRVIDLIDELQQACRDAPEEHVNEIGESTPIRRIYDEVIRLVESSGQKDTIAGASGERCFALIYGDAQKRLEIEVMVRLLGHLCRLSVAAGRHFPLYLTSSEDDKLFNANATVALLQEGFLELQQADVQAAKALKGRRQAVLPYLRDLLDQIMLGDNSVAMRADFVLTYDALGQWLMGEPDNEALRDIMSKLQTAPRQVNGMPSPPQHDKRDQLEYIFEEWIRLVQRRDTPEHSYLAFVQQLEDEHIVSESNESLSFYRTCLEMCCTVYERVTAAPYGTQDAAYVHIDAFARLIAYVTVFKGPVDGEPRPSRAKTLEAVLTLVLLVANDHQVRQRERFNGRVYFRLMSALLCEMHDLRAHLQPQDELELAQVFASALHVLQPRHYNAFALAWLGLVSHRLFVPVLLGASGRSNGGWETFTTLLCTVFNGLDEMLRSEGPLPVIQDHYRSIDRFLLLLHHDFPEFLIENHSRLNSSIPQGCVQLHNLINSAVPRLTEQPDPFTPGLKINRLDQVRQAPAIAGDVGNALEEAGIKDLVERACGGPSISEEECTLIATALAPTDGPANTLLANALVLYIGVQATSASSVFSSAAPPARLLERLLLRETRPTARHHVATAMVNQVRYVNAHTHYFSTALQHMVTIATEEVQEQVLITIMERLMAPRPHPWGVIVMMLELIKNPTINIWELPSTKAAPQIQQMLANLVHNQDPGRLPRSPMGGMM